MTRSSFFNERCELPKAGFSKVKVVVISIYFACATRAKKKQNIDYLNFDAKVEQ